MSIDILTGSVAMAVYIGASCASIGNFCNMVDRDISPCAEWDGTEERHSPGFVI